MLTPTGQDIFFSESSLEVGRNFCNKIFQATKLVLGFWDEAQIGCAASNSAPHASDGLDMTSALEASTAQGPAAALTQLWRQTFGSEIPVTIKDADLDLADLWILDRICSSARECNDNMERRRLNDATYTVFNFFRHELCDWYLEAIKPRLRDEKQRGPALVVAVLNLALSYKLLHPAMPFITEELWSWLPPAQGYLMTSPYPTYRGDSPFRQERDHFELIMAIVTIVRNLRSEMAVPPGKRGHVILRVHADDLCQQLQDATGMIALLAKLAEVEVALGGEDPSPAGIGVAGPVEVFLLMAGLVDVGKERERISKELAKVEKWLKGSNAKLTNEKFLANAPADVIQKQRELQADNEAKVEKLRKRLAAMQ
jgi:valyl-tRNA synthetase